MPENKYLPQPFLHEWMVMHYSDVGMSEMVSQISGVSIVCSTVCSGDQNKHQSTASLAFVRVNPPVTNGFLSQRVSCTEIVSIWWRHYVILDTHSSSCCSIVGAVINIQCTSMHYKLFQCYYFLCSHSYVLWWFLIVYQRFIDLGLALLMLSWDKNWDSHSPMNGYPSFYPRIALVAPSPDGRSIRHATPQ